MIGDSMDRKLQDMLHDVEIELSNTEKSQQYHDILHFLSLCTCKNRTKRLYIDS